MSEGTSEHLKHPLLKTTWARGSFKETSEFIENDVLAQNIVLSLDNAIKMEERTQNTPQALKYFKLYKKISFIKMITL
jgi:hypothetical protein